MLRYLVSPTDPGFEPVEIVAHDPGPILNLVERMRCGEADVHREGAYAFSVRLDGNGLWTIYNREASMPAEPASVRG